MARKQTLVSVMTIIVYCDARLQDSYSKLQYGHRLDRKVINSFVDFSILDCAEECLRTTRCKSVSYYKGANFCEINYENKSSANDSFLENPGWIYSEREDWDIDIVSSCSASNCSINEKCKPLPMGKFECVLSDCGIPSQRGVNLSSVGRWEGIGIQRFMKLGCYQNCSQSGSRMFVCAPNGQWKTNLKCVINHCASSPCQHGGECTSNETTFSCQCKDGYKGDTCEDCKGGGIPYKDHCYKLHREERTWFDAKRKCKTEGGAYLLEINFPEENSWIKETFSSCSGPALWIGMHRRGKEEKFVWIKSGNILNDSSWRPIQPNNHNEKTCVEFTKEGKWNATKCSNQRRFVCEMNI